MILPAPWDRALVALLIAWASTTAAKGEPAATDLTDLPSPRPVQVTVDFDLVEISQIQDHDEKIGVEFDLFLTWRDPRLAFDPGPDGPAKKELPSGSTWTPRLRLADDLDVNVEGDEVVHVRPDGTAVQRLYYRGSVGAHFDLHAFPFDAHRLEVALESAGDDVDEMSLVAGACSVRGEDRVVPHGWELVATTCSAAESHYPRIDETAARYVFLAEVRREPHYYWWAIVVPLVPIVMTSWSVFWMDRTEFGTQVGVGITAMLTVVAYRITIDSALPPLTYMTMMDGFLLLCQVFVFLSFALSVLIHVYSVRECTEVAEAITRRCRWVPPLAMALILAALLLPSSLRTAATVAMILISGALLGQPLARGATAWALHLPKLRPARVRQEQ